MDIAGALGDALAFLRTHPFFSLGCVLAASLPTALLDQIPAWTTEASWDAIEVYVRQETGQHWMDALLTSLGRGVLVAGYLTKMDAGALDMGEALRRGVGVFGRIVGIRILGGLAILVGLVFLIVPGIVFAAALSLAVPIAVDTRSGVMESMHAAWAMSRGTLAKLVTFLGVPTVLYLAFVACIWFGPEIGEPPQTPEAWLAEHRALLLVGSLGSIAFSVVLSLFPAAAYLRLRGASRPVDADRVAEVFS